MAIFGLLIIRRIFHAFSASFRLLSDVDVLRRLPWLYLRRLPLRNLWIGILTITLPLSLLGSLTALAIRGDTGANLASLAWLAALIGVLSAIPRSIVRGVKRR
jgi:energy-converting hydrogenase Eha subunit A